MIHKSLPLIIVFLVIKFVGFSQQFKEFTQEPEAFIDEMLNLFERDETNYKKGKDLLVLFEEPWLNGGFSIEKQNKIYEISNMLLKKRARNFPHFYDYLKTVLAFYNNPVDSLNYFEWEKGIQFLAQNNKMTLRDVSNFINKTYYLVIKKAVYYSNTIQWYSTTNNYNIKLDGDTLKFIFPNLDLIGKLRSDSILIHETSGVYYPLLNLWKGNSARIYWEKAGLDKNMVWAEIGNYSFLMNKAFYSIDNIKFYNKFYFDYPLLGTLTDKIVEVNSPETLSYPRFNSKKSNFIIDGIFQDINYQGGVSMQGSKLVGSGTQEHPATIMLYRDVELVEGEDTILEKQLFMKTSSLYYAFSQDEVVSRNCKISIIIDTDSIYHPGLQFRYFDINREINLIRDNDPENMSRSPYYNTYHKIEMDFELLKWAMSDEKVDFTMLRGSSINIANFESQDFFNAARFYEVQGLEQVHPYNSLRRYYRKYDTKVFHEEDLAKFMRYPIAPVRRMLIDFTYRGIVDYDTETGFCTIKPKLFKYLDAIAGRRDYDLIRFESRTSAPLNNAILNLRNMDLAIQGVPLVNVSDSQNVVFYPRNQEILLKKNRDFDFGGRVEAGYFNFYGDNFQFKYDSFKVALNEVDSLSIKVKTGVDNWGQRILTNVENVIEDVTGDVVIDDPLNKSGIKSYPRYPIFESKQDSYVYYDAKDIQRGKYVRDKFFFIIYPYEIDSLNNFSTKGMGYDGELHSADIFPVIKQPLVLQRDNSLGFHHKTPANGYNTYIDKGQYYSDISLSNRGLRGDGHLEYLTSKTYSKDFIFYPDSANSYTSSFNISKQISRVQYPEVIADSIYEHWMPYSDELFLKTVETSFTMYAEKAKHQGGLLYTPEDLTGYGTMAYNEGELSSKLIKYKADNFSADTADFLMNSVNPDMLAFTTENVNAKVDYISMKSSFKSNTGTSKVELPENLYHAYIEQFSWLMLQKTMKLSTPNKIQIYERGENRIVNADVEGNSPIGSLFVSIHKGQDSLNWVSAETDFDLKTNILSAHQVKYIDVADATVFPNEGEIVVEPKAYIRTLRNADLLANRESKYHRFHSATINILTRNKYHGSGSYNYEDEIGRSQAIQFDIIAVDSLTNTYARGTVKGLQDFSLSPAFGFRGKVSLKAENPLLYFDGHTKINHVCDAMQESWLKFETEIDPNNIYIPLDEQPKDINDNFLVSGAMLATDSIHVFPAFLSPRKRYSNMEVMTAKGYLTYRSKEKKYIIGEKYRINNNDTVGDILTLHKNYCQLYGEGNIDLTADLGQVKINSKGNGIYKIPEDQLRLDLLMTVDFFFPEKCMKFIADTLQTMTALWSVDLKSRTYTQGVRELLSYTEADQMFKEQNIFGTVKKLPEALNTSFVFANLNMLWDKKQTAWISKGDIGIANILGNQINRKIGGTIAITRKRSGNSLDLYIEISETHWYYFNYKRGLMQAYSSETAFNEMIAGVKGDDRKMKIQKGESSYVFFLSNKKKRDDFIKRIKGESVDEEEGEVDYEQYENFD